MKILIVTQYFWPERFRINDLAIGLCGKGYLACGRPVVAALDGEGARVIGEACAGFAAGAGDPAGLAEAVLTMYRLSEEAHEEMGNRARLYFEQHFERNKLLGVLDGWMREFAPGANQ